jgi:hypothetical protein
MKLRVHGGKYETRHIQSIILMLLANIFVSSKSISRGWFRNGLLVDIQLLFMLEDNPQIPLLVKEVDSN